MSSGIQVRVDLTPNAWQASSWGGKGGWRCSALRIPGSRFVGLAAGPTDVDQDWYKVRGSFISWRGGSSPAGTLQAMIELPSPWRARALSLLVLLSIGALTAAYFEPELVRALLNRISQMSVLR